MPRKRLGRCKTPLTVRSAWAILLSGFAVVVPSIAQEGLAPDTMENAEASLHSLLETEMGMVGVGVGIDDTRVAVSANPETDPALLEGQLLSMVVMAGRTAPWTKTILAALHLDGAPLAYMLVPTDVFRQADAQEITGEEFLAACEFTVLSDSDYSPTANEPDDPKGPGRPDDHGLTDQIQVRAESVQSWPKTSVAVPLWLEFPRVFSRSREGRVNLVQMEIDLAYDPNVVRSSGAVLEGNLAGNTTLETRIVRDGLMRIRFTSSPSVQTDGIFAQVPFGIIGQAGQRSPVSIRVASVTDDRGRTPTCIVRPGSIIIIASSNTEPPGREPPSGIDKTVSMNPVADNYVYAYSYMDWHNTNWGAHVTASAGWHPAGGESRAYFRFDLPEIPRVEKATLRLYQCHTAGPGDLDLGIHVVLSAWQEGTGVYPSTPEAGTRPGDLTWNHQPASVPSPVVTFRPTKELNAWVEIDVTDLVNAWLDGVPNHGLLVKAQGQLTGSLPECKRGFRTREYEDASQRPMLVLDIADRGSDNGPDVADTSGDSDISDTEDDETDPTDTRMTRQAYQEYIAAYNRLKSLMAAGKGDTPEAQAAYRAYKEAKDRYESLLPSGP